MMGVVIGVCTIMILTVEEVQHSTLLTYSILNSSPWEINPVEHRNLQNHKHNRLLFLYFSVA